MKGEPTGFWAKLDHPQDAAGCEWHPLSHHCADVAAVAEALLALPLWRARLSQLAGRDLVATDCARLSVLAGLHDLGKLSLGFQAKGRPELGPVAGHVIEALAALYHGGVFTCLGNLAAWGQPTERLLAAAFCHHGQPHSIRLAATEWQASWWRPLAGLDPAAGAVEILSMMEKWLPGAFVPGGPALPDEPLFEHAFAGLVMLADWLASDPDLFPYGASLEPDRMPMSRQYARRVMDEMALRIEPHARVDELARDAFRRIASPDYSPRPTQRAALELPVDDVGSITVMEAETGSGKTEAALARFVTLFEAGAVDGMYFALPTRTAATQIHRRVREALQRALRDPPPVILAVPGYLRVDDVDGRRLAPFDVLWPDRDRFRYRGWAAESPKRYLAGCIVVGTIDQVLLSSLMVNHAHLRAVSLLRHLLVIDEVHASDEYMARITEDVLARHIRSGGHALLLSATLGAEARVRLVHPGERRPAPDLCEAESTPYPLLTHRAAATTAFPVAREGGGRSIELQAEPWLEAHRAVAQRALLAAAGGAKVLVIKNTVADCVRTQLELERGASELGVGSVLFTCAGVQAPHHARFARADREALDTALEASFGRNRSPGGCVVVATQTVQQSLDLDADLLLTDLCPADVLLQRLGRLHRHHRDRPREFATPRAVVIVPADRDLGRLIRGTGEPIAHHGLGSVYRDLRHIEATWRLVEAQPRWLIPEMNRYLVERSLHSSMLAEIVREGGGAWSAHAAVMIGTGHGKARHAELNLVDWSRRYTDMSFPAQNDERIRTRLGEGDRRVRFDPPVDSAFGQVVSSLVLPAWWSAGAPPDALEAESVDIGSATIRFGYGGRRFVYDRLGLRPEPQSGKGEVNEDGP